MFLLQLQDSAVVAQKQPWSFISERVCLCPNKTLFVETGWPMSYSLLSPDRGENKTRPPNWLLISNSVEAFFINTELSGDVGVIPPKAVLKL